MTQRVLESRFICYCRVVTNGTSPDFDPYASVGIVKKIFKNRLPSDRSPSNVVSDGNILSSNMFKADLLNVILNNEIFPLKTIQEGTDGSLDTILYNAVNDFRFGDKVSFIVRLETTIDENDFISPRIKLLYNRNNTIEETMIPLFELD